MPIVPIAPIAPDAAVALVQGEADRAIDAMNRFAADAFQTRGGRLGSGMGSLLEALWVYFTNRALHNEGGVAADCEIGWLEDHEPNDFACVVRDAPWNSSTREGELFRIEAKSMNLGVDESKAHFTELQSQMGDHDQLVVLIWRWLKIDDWRSCPEVTSYLLCPARPIAVLRDKLHIARGGTFVESGACPDGCALGACSHVGEPLNKSGKRERKTGPATTRGSEDTTAANNFGGLVRMLKTATVDARAEFRAARAVDPVAHTYISFIHKAFPAEEVSQYLTAEWRTVAQHAGLTIAGKSKQELAEELRATTPGYQELLRDLLAP